MPKIRPLGWIKSFLTTNATAKAMALVMATAVWFYAYYSDLTFKPLQPRRLRLEARRGCRNFTGWPS